MLLIIIRVDYANFAYFIYKFLSVNYFAYHHEFWPRRTSGWGVVTKHKKFDCNNSYAKTGKSKIHATARFFILWWLNALFRVIRPTVILSLKTQGTDKNYSYLHWKACINLLNRVLTSPLSLIIKKLKYFK